MVSRETRVHVAVLALAVLGYQAALVLASVATVDPGPPLAIAFALLVYGGAHAYLAWRGHDGMVPVASRTRFVVMLLALALLGIVHGSIDTSETILGVRVGAMLLATGLVVVLGYWIVEARQGYGSTAG